MTNHPIIIRAVSHGGTRRGVCGARVGAGFTLIELLVSTVVLVVIVGIAFSILSQTSNVLGKSLGKLEAFQASRTAFDLMTRNVGAATLNTYLDYDNVNLPTRYLRQSELQFVCTQAGANGTPGAINSGTAVFFYAPLAQTAATDSGGVLTYGGLNEALNACGYYVEFGPDLFKPAHVAGSGKYRYRLVQLTVPVEGNMVYTDKSEDGYKWLFPLAKQTGGTPCVFPVADNVIALIVQPDDPADPNLFSSSFEYNTRLGAAADPQPVAANQLPPTMKVTMITIDEASAVRMENGTAPPALIATALKDRFHDPAELAGDLEFVRQSLINGRVSFRVMTSIVPIRGSKWTK